MKRVMTWATALIVVIAGFAVMGENQASAGLFSRNKCKPAKCKKVRRNKCCHQVSHCSSPCEQAAPCGCEAAAPCGCEQAPAEPCGCETASCGGCQTKCTTCCSRRQIRKAKRKGCCPQQCSSCNSCGEAAAPCGCEGAAPAAGAEKAPDLPEDATT